MAREKPIVDAKDGSIYVLAQVPVYVKTAMVCKMTGKSHQWIGQLTNDGVLNKIPTPHGAMYNLEDTVSAYLTMLENRTDADDDESRGILQKKEKANAALAMTKAKRAALELNEFEGKMHRSEDVAALTEDLIFEVRNGLMALPGRLAVTVVEAKTPAEASEIIRKEVYKLMEELSNYEYDPAKYEERVRDRLNMDAIETEDGDE